MKRVLVIEDDPEVRECLAETLAFEGYSVSAAGNGREGIKKAHDGLPNLITLDLRMPVMSGWQFMAARVGDPQLADIPVILISAESKSGYDSHCGDVVARFFKPCDMDALLAAVARFATAEAMPQPVARSWPAGTVSGPTNGAPLIG